MSATILDKIAKVLAKAENTDNEHEADAFLAHAQRMATAHSIDMALARRHVAKAHKRETPVQRTITVGAPRALGNAKMVALFLTIARNNDLTCNIAHNSTYVVAYGFPSDIEVTEALYAHVVFQMVEAANAYLKSGAFRDEYVWDPRTRQFKTPSAKAARLSFYDAFTVRIGSRLAKAKDEAEAAAAATETDEAFTGGTALVLADKRAEVADFYKANSTARGSWRGNRRPQARSNSAAAAGDEAGAKARLSAVPTLPESRRSVTT